LASCYRSAYGCEKKDTGNPPSNPPCKP
jgi:hypothetical protein